MQTKKNIYIIAFTILGLVFGLLIKSLIEIIYIKLLVKDFVTYSFGLTWDELIWLHNVLTLLIIVVCGLWGYASGKYWWHQIYVLKKYSRKPWHL